MRLDRISERMCRSLPALTIQTPWSGSSGDLMTIADVSRQVFLKRRRDSVLVYFRVPP